jgi:hypothetical protein
MSSARAVKGALCAVLVLLACGCVERRIFIRSYPPGASVWVDEEYVGETPLAQEFAHYGWRRIRVGPVRNAAGKVLYREQQKELAVRAPWYETFPVDFFFEVVWPFTLRDVHTAPIFVLEPVEPVPAASTEDGLDQLLRRADAFRQRGLTPAPEEG